MEATAMQGQIAPPPPSSLQQQRLQQQRRSPGRGAALRLTIAVLVVTFHFYYIVSETRRMSTTLFVDHSSEYDSPLFFSGSGAGGGGERSSSSSSTSKLSKSSLPRWLASYLEWHVEMRARFPGDEILTHPDSPGVIVKSCAYKCGGLHDRLGGLGWDLYLANQTGRVMLLHWCIPAPVESWLVPNVVDWTLPRNSSALDNERLFSNTTEVHIHCDRAHGEWKGLFDGYVEYMQGEDFFERHVDEAIHRAVHGEYAKHKILRYKVLGVDQRLEQRLRIRHNETDPISWSDAFPTLFWMLFKPSDGLQRELDDTFRQLRISAPFDYNAPPFYAIHARIRHPRGHMEQDVEAKVKGSPDKMGLNFTGSTRRFAVGVAKHALECAQASHLERHVMHVPQYFFYADSEDLVTYMGEEHGADGVRVRNMTGVEVLHIDRQQQRPPESYYSAFVDLFVAAQASCIVFGAGNYALLAAKINVRGARQCLIRHYPDSSHPMVLRQEFLDCNERWDLIPTTLERTISDLPEYTPP